MNESILDEKPGFPSPFLEPAPPAKNELWICDEPIDYASEDEDDTEVEGDEDLLSLDSYSAGGPWPAFLPQKKANISTSVSATASASSLRSSYSLDVYDLRRESNNRSTVSTLGVRILTS